MRLSLPIASQEQFVYHQSMDAEHSAEASVSRIAAAIGEPARARMLYCLLDGHARTSTELALVAEVSPSTASVHLAQLKERGLVRVLAQGKHRYYSLEGTRTAAALEALMVVAVGPGNHFVPNTPPRLRAARTCYDHIAGTIAVAMHDRLKQLAQRQQDLNERVRELQTALQAAKTEPERDEIRQVHRGTIMSTNSCTRNCLEAP